MNKVISLNEKNIIGSNVKLAKEGDKAAFEALIIENRLSLYRVAKGILKNEEDSADAIQEAIIKAYKGIKHLKKDEYFKTWLIKILINECNAIARSKAKTLPLKEVISETKGYEEEYFGTEVFMAVSLLEKDLREVTLLFYYEDFSVKTISSILKIPEGTVKSRLSRARTKLNEYLKEGGTVNER